MRSSVRRRAGVSLLELILAMIIATILFGAMMAAVSLMSGSAMLETDSPATETSDAARLVEQITADLRLALVFNERGPSVVEFTVPDRDGDDSPELIRYEWTGAPSYELTRLVDLSDDLVVPDPVVLADEVNQFDLTYLLRTWGLPPPPPGLVSEEMLLVSHDEQIDLTANRLLFVVTSSGGPTTQEQYRKALFESWGYSVAMISATDSPAAYDLEVGLADVAYISEEIDSTDVSTKLRDAGLGVVNEEINLVDELGLAGQFGFPPAALSLDVGAEAHYITAPIPPGAVTLFGSLQALTNIDPDPSHHAPNLRILGDWGGLPSLAVLDWADEIYDPAAGSLPTVLLVVQDENSLDGEESARRTLLESWGYTVDPISDDASQAAFDAAVAGARVAYVCAGASPGDLGIKLVGAPVGVVTELLLLADEFGLEKAGNEINSKSIDVIDTSHFVTATHVPGPQDICDDDQPLTKYKDADAGAARVLAEADAGGSDPALVLLETGDPLAGGGNAAGRRVFMPWGGPDFDVGKLKLAGETLMERAVEWAAGFGVAGFDKAFPVQTPEDFDKKHVATQITIPTDARITDLAAYVIESGDREVRLGIYTDEAGEPGRLLAQTAKEKPSGLGAFWYAAELPNPVTVPAGTYWLAFGMHKDIAYHYDPTGGQTRHADSGADPKNGLMTQWAGTYESSTRRVSMYAMYEEADVADGRRVELPWGGNAFEIDALTPDGNDLLRRCIEWAADKPDVFTGVDVGDKIYAAQYFMPTLPENTLEWSVTKVLVRLRADDDLDGDLTFELRHVTTGLVPSSSIIAATPEIPEDAFDPNHFTWFEIPFPPALDLNPEYGICLVVHGDRKRSAVLTVDVGALAPTADAHYMISTDDGATWSAPNDTDDMRIYVYGTYTTTGEPQWP